MQQVSNEKGARQMRQAQAKNRNRTRNNNAGNPLRRSYESVGPTGTVRGTASHIVEKYLARAHDATVSSDHVMAENYYQHAEHYSRLILAATADQDGESDELATMLKDQQTIKNAARAERESRLGRTMPQDGGSAAGQRRGARSSTQSNNRRGTNGNGSGHQGEARGQGRNGQNKSKQNKAGQNKSNQNRASQNKTGQKKNGQNKAGQNKTVQAKKPQSRTNGRRQTGSGSQAKPATRPAANKESAAGQVGVAL